VVVERLDPWRNVEIPPSASGAGNAHLTDPWPALTGAAAMHLFSGHRQLNLLPPEMRRREAARQRWPWLAAAAMLALLAGIGPWRFHRVATEVALLKSASIERELAPLRARATQWAAATRQRIELEREITARRELFDRRTTWLEFFADVEGRLARVDGAWFERLQVITAPGTPTKLAVSGRLRKRETAPADEARDGLDRFKSLVTAVAGSPFVDAVEGERMDFDQAGSVKFEFVLVANPRRPL
jgi:type IV pilus assembly protein PilM